MNFASMSAALSTLNPAAKVITGDTTSTKVALTLGKLVSGTQQVAKGTKPAINTFMTQFETSRQYHNAVAAGLIAK